MYINNLWRIAGQRGGYPAKTLVPASGGGMAGAIFKEIAELLYH